MNVRTGQLGPLAVAVAIALVATACQADDAEEVDADTSGATDSNGDVEPSGEAMSFTFGHNAPGDSPTGEAADYFAELVLEMSDGAIEIEVFPDNQLGDNRDLVEQTTFGGIEFSLAGLGVLGPFEDGYNLMQVPFLFENQNHINEVVSGDIGRELADAMRENEGIVLLDQSWDRMPRQLSSDFPIETLSDLSGLILRVGTDAAAQTFDMLGASPTSVPLNETYTSLEQGIIDGVELPTDFMFNLSIYEVNATLTMNNHTYGTQFLAMHGDTYEGLTEGDQQILTEAAQEAGVRNDELTAEQEQGFVDQLEDAGMEIFEPSDAQRQEFIDAVEANLDELEAIWPGAQGLGQRIIDSR